MAEQDGAALEATTGLTVLAMGKYGAYELNYSSDIDLIVFYDADVFPSPSAAMRAARRWISCAAWSNCWPKSRRMAMSSAPICRLRPDAGATQVAISLDAAEAYYESLGQNWERAAMIKARPCAGDPRNRRRFPVRDRAFHLAAESGLRRHRGHPFHQAPDPRPWRPWRDRGGGAQYQAGTRRHPRDRIFRPDAATDPGRPQSSSARARDAGRAGRRWRAHGTIRTRRRRNWRAPIAICARWNIACR